MSRSYLGLILVATFSLGYVVNDILRETSFDVISEARADVAGMSYRALRRDRDFKKAVQYVVSGNCYVDSEYIYC